MFIVILLFFIILTATNCIKWDTLNLSPDFRGRWDSTEQYWTGQLEECDGQCKAAGFQVCGSNQKQCCYWGMCVEKFGIEVCDGVVYGFVCEVQNQQLLLKNTLSPTAFPQLDFLYNWNMFVSSHKDKYLFFWNSENDYIAYFLAILLMMLIYHSIYWIKYALIIPTSLIKIINKYINIHLYQYSVNIYSTFTNKCI
jgi:hypothetical protein